MTKLEIVKAIDLKWTRADHTAFSCTAFFKGIPPLPYHAVKEDLVAHGAELFLRGASGEFGDIADFEG